PFFPFLLAMRNGFAIQGADRLDSGEKRMNGDNDRTGDTLPVGLKAIPFPRTTTGPSLRLCLLARQEAHPALGFCVRLRDFPGGQVFLGCLTDYEGRPHEWVEIWVQTSQGLRQSDPLAEASFSATARDARWMRLCDVFEN